MPTSLIVHRTITESSVSVVVGFDDPVGKEKMAAKVVPGRNMTDTQIFTIH